MEQIQIIEKLFYYIVTFSYLLFPIAFFLSKSKKSEIVPVVLLGYGIVCCVFLFLIRTGIIPREFRVYFQTCYTFFEYIIFTLIFWVNIKNKNVHRLILGASTLFFLFQLIYLLSGQVRGLDTIPIGIETILVLTYIIYFFYDFSKNLRSLYIYNHYAFWISVGILIYLGGSFFFFILFDHLSHDQITTFGNMTYLAEILKNVLFTLAIFIYNRYPVEKRKEQSTSVPYLDMI